jgi:hypothetical protein
MTKSIEYSQAKSIIDSFQLHEEKYINVSHLANFRKYLREIVSKRQGSEQFTTRYDTDKKQIKVIRIR